MTAFLDTNVLLYSVSGASDEAHKRELARKLIDAGDVALSVQVLQEFYVQATRPTRADRLEPDTTHAFVAAWRRFPVQEITLALLDSSFSVMTRHRFSFWDSMVVAAALAQGCDMLLSEDMDDGRIVNDMRMANPFGQ